MLRGMEDAVDLTTLVVLNGPRMFFGSLTCSPAAYYLVFTTQKQLYAAPQTGPHVSCVGINTQTLLALQVQRTCIG